MKKIRLTSFLPRRLYKILLDISPLFLDYDLEDPRRGALTRALEHILQYYMESSDYQKKIKVTRKRAMEFIDYLCEKDKELLADKIKKFGIT